jgi:trimeric autotransporter adhesin
MSSSHVRSRLVLLVVSLVLLVPLTTLARFAGVRETGSGLQTGALTPLSALLNADGTLRDHHGVEGSVDARGYGLAVDARGAPRFVPTTALAVAGDERWDDRFGYPGLKYGQVNAIAIDEANVYVAGSFSEAAALPTANVVRWDGRRWYGLGDGLKNAYGSNATVYALAMSDDGLYAGGDFVASGTSLLGGIARWDGTQWQAVGDGQGPRDSYGYATPIRALAWADGTLYAGGDFSSVDGVPALSVARWSGGAWSALGAGVGNSYGSVLTAGSVRTIAVGDSGVYVGGAFSTAGTVAANAIARWDGTTWSSLAGGITGSGTVSAIAVDGANVYAGGDFSSVGNVSASKVALWNSQTQAWSALGAGISQPTYATVAALHAVDGVLYVGGTFTGAGTTTARNLARWNGTAWQSVGSGEENGVDGTVYAIASGPDGMYIGGGFTKAGTTYANEIVRWDGAAWQALGEGIGFSSIPGSLNAVAVDAQGRVYVGGFPTHAGGMPMQNIAMWDGARWHDLGGGVDSTVHAITVAGDNVYVGGSFTRAGNVSANHIARWNIATQRWYALSSGINGNVYALATDGTDVYAGGDFSAAGSISVEKIARWNGTAWSSLGEGVDFDSGRVEALTVTDDGQHVVVGGDFTFIYAPNDVSIKVNGVLLWSKADGEWYLLGQGEAVGVTRNSGSGDFGGTVNAVAVIGGDVYVGGRFDKAGTAAAANIARWESATNTWHALQDSVGGTSSPEVRALSVIGTDLFVGGTFTVAGTATDVGHLARWDSVAGTWATLGSGVGLDEYDDGVNAIAAYGTGIYVGGSFVTAGSQPSSGFARWGAPAQNATVTVAQGGTLNAAGVTITFPPNAVPEPVTLTLTDLFAPPAPAPEGEQVVRAFDLEARTAGGTAVTQFQRDYTLRVTYTDADVAARGLNENTLRLAYWDGTRWVGMTGTVDKANNTVTVQADHFTVFALLGKQSTASATPTETTGTATPTETTVTATPTGTSGTPEPTGTAATPEPTGTAATPEPTGTAATPQPTGTRTPPAEHRINVPLVRR